MECPKCKGTMEGEIIKGHWIEYVCGECNYHVGGDTGLEPDFDLERVCKNGGEK